MHRSGSAFRARQTSKPSMSGMSTSSRIRSGFSRLAASRPALPPSAQRISTPSLARRCVATAMASRLSSMIRIFITCSFRTGRGVRVLVRWLGRSQPRGRKPTASLRRPAFWRHPPAPWPLRSARGSRSCLPSLSAGGPPVAALRNAGLRSASRIVRDLAVKTRDEAFEDRRHLRVVGELRRRSPRRRRAGTAPLGRGRPIVGRASLFRRIGQSCRISRARSIGLARWSLQPAARHRSASPDMALAVSARIGRS